MTAEREKMCWKWVVGRVDGYQISANKYQEAAVSERRPTIGRQSTGDASTRKQDAEVEILRRISSDRLRMTGLGMGQWVCPIR